MLLVNTKSLKGSEWLEESKEKLGEAGFKLTDAVGFTKAKDLFERVKKEMGTDKLIIIGGGDGTQSGAANILAKSDTIMGVLPLGTGNAFARDLRIETDLDEAIDVIVNGNTEEVDLGVYNEGYFLNVATIGITADVAKTITVPLKRRFGRFSYGIALWKALKEMEPFRATIDTSNGKTEVNTVQIVIGNGHYHGGPLPLAPTAAITSGKLRLYAVEASKPGDLLKYALLLPTGLMGALKEVHSESTTGGVITTSPSQDVVVDGELVCKTPLKFSVAPGALRVRVPKDFKG